MLSKTLCQGSWWYSYINLNTKNLDFFMKILSSWPWPQSHPRVGDCADKNFRPVSTTMLNMNETHQRVFKIWGLINFNAKALTLWRKDERTNVRMNELTDERKSKNYIPSHTSYVGGITSLDISCESSAKQMIHMKCQTSFLWKIKKIIKKNCRLLQLWLAL